MIIHRFNKFFIDPVMMTHKRSIFTSQDNTIIVYENTDHGIQIHIKPKALMSYENKVNSLQLLTYEEGTLRLMKYTSPEELASLRFKGDKYE